MSTIGSETTLGTFTFTKQIDITLMQRHRSSDFIFVLPYIVDLMLNIGKRISKNNKLHISNLCKEPLPWDTIID